MTYVLISPVTAEAFNRGLCRLLRPSHLRGDDYVTDLYAPMHTHPNNGWMALELPDTETVPLHLEADGSELAAVLDIFVQDGALTQQQADGLVTAVTQLRGQEVRIADFIPDSWSDAVLSKEQMEAQGWWPEDAEL